jgi:hypothetical protein
MLTDSQPRDGSCLQGQIDRATFISRGNSFTQRQINSIHLLHYRSLVSPKPRGKERKVLVHQSYAEIILQPASNGSSLSKLIVEGIRWFRSFNSRHLADEC